MGNQQLLLIVLSTILVLAAVAMGLDIFRGGVIESNREAIISDIVQQASKAQKYYRTSTVLGGGSRSFDNYSLTPIDTGNLNGSYSLSTTQPSSNNFVPGSITKLSGTAGQIFITGCGREEGDDRVNPVKAFVRVTVDSIQTTVLN